MTDKIVAPNGEMLNEYSGELIRQKGAFALASHAGPIYALELPRTPVDLFGKNVVVTGKLADNGEVIVAPYIREQD